MNNPFIPQIRCTKGWPEDFLPSPALAIVIRKNEKKGIEQIDCAN